MRYAFVLILLSACLLRLYDLNDYPLPIFQDELTNLYDAYAIAETGKDRWGDARPILLRSLGEGDYRTAMYAWLTTIPVKILGPTTVAVRLPSAIMGILSLVLLFYVVRQLHSNRAALLAMIIGTFSPWHMLYSRLGFEAPMLSAFSVMLILALWMKVRNKDFHYKWATLLGLTVGLTANGYHPFKLVSVVLLVLITIDTYYNKRKLTTIACIYVAAIIGALPQFWALTMETTHYLARPSHIMLETDNAKAFIYYTIINSFKNLGPNFLFLSFGVNYDYSIGRLLPVELPFFYIGLVAVFYKFGKQQKRFPLFIMAAIISSILPCAFTNESPNAMRISTLVSLTPIITTAGILFVHDLLGPERHKRILLIVASLFVIANGCYCISRYKGNMEYRNWSQQHFTLLLGQKIVALKDDYKSVLVNDANRLPLYLLWKGNVHPKDFKSLPMKIHHTSGGWDRFRQLGNVHFFTKNDFPDTLASHHHYLLISRKIQDKHDVIDSVAFGNQVTYLQEARD